MTAADKIRRAAAQYTAHPFAVTYALLLPVLTWFAIVIGALELLRGGPGQSFADGVGSGLLVGTVATAGALGVLHAILRKRGPK